VTTPFVYVTTLAEIITSPYVGGIHVRRVGELLIAREDLSSRLLDDVANRLSDHEFDEIVVRATELDDKYVQVWRACTSGSRQWRHTEGLAALEVALRKAAEYYRRVASELY
jgi:hypothetical protein